MVDLSVWPSKIYHLKTLAALRLLEPIAVVPAIGRTQRRAESGEAVALEPVTLARRGLSHLHWKATCELK